MSQERLLANEILARWEELTFAEVNHIVKAPEELAGLLQERYGFGRSRAEKEVGILLAEFAERLYRAKAA